MRLTMANENGRARSEARRFLPAQKDTRYKRGKKMKKSVKLIFGGLFAVALLTNFISCSDGDDDDETNQKTETQKGADKNKTEAEAADVYSGDLITFTATKASTSAEDTSLIIKYDRSQAGAKEKISFTDADLEVKYNDTAISMKKTISFELDEYGAKFDEADSGSDNLKEYKVKISLGKKIATGDSVTVQLKSANVEGEGAKTANLASIVISLIDTAEAASYYTELCANEDEYQTLITKKNGVALDAEEEEPAKETKPTEEATAQTVPTTSETQKAETTNAEATANETQKTETATTSETTTTENPVIETTTTETTPTETAPTETPATETPATETPATETPATETPAAEDETLTKTSILGGIQSGENVWGSGTTTTQNDDGTYTVLAAGAGEGGWGGNIAAIPVCFGAGDLAGFTHIVFEADLSAFTLNEENPEYPSIELKIANADDSESKTISATALFSNGKAEIPLTEFNFLDEATKIQFAIRGSGKIILKDISKAK